MKRAFLLYSLFVATYTFSQNKKDTTAVNHLEEVVLSTVRIPKKKEALPIQVETITLKQIEFQNFQNTADLLSNSGTLLVQKSQQGGGSPTIRGFEASRVLLVVDGIRMNNLIYRSGHLQNVISVDENLLENVSVFYGPTSTLFGSDALGGTINMTTKKAKFISNQVERISGNVLTRYSSVNEEKSSHFELNYAKENWASLTSFSYNDFGDLKMGKRKNHNGNFFGERPFYIENIDGVDVLTENKDKFIQKNSGFKQYNLMQKIAYKSQKGFEHGLNFQFSNSTDIPRYDRLTDASSSGLKNAEWYYGPQKRLLGIYSLTKEKAFLNSDLKIDFAYQNVEESRHNRRFKNYNLQNRIEKVNMYSISIDLHKEFSKSDLFYGVESYLEDLNSSAFSNNINTGEIKKIDTRYPNGKNNMLRNDLYVSYNTILSKETNFNIGARAGFTILNSTISDDTFFALPFNDINQKNCVSSSNPNTNYSIIRPTSLKRDW